MGLMLCSHLTFAFVSTSPSNTQNGFRPILCICVCVSIDTMLNFDGDVDANANVKCEHSVSIVMCEHGFSMRQKLVCTFIL